MRRSKERTSETVFILSSNDKLLSSLIKKGCCTYTFLNHFREAHEQLLCVLFRQNQLCGY